MLETTLERPTELKFNVSSEKIQKDDSKLIDVEHSLHNLEGVLDAVTDYPDVTGAESIPEDIANVYLKG